MTERPILFNTDMVRAIRDGHKTMTRRPVVGWFDCNSQRFHHLERDDDPYVGTQAYFQIEREGLLNGIRCPFGAPGNRLWVRETFAENVPGCEAQGGYSYRADHQNADGDGLERIKWRPSIHMPRCAARLILEITEIGVERVQDITEADAQAEGVGEEFSLSFRGGFANMWNDLYGSRGYGWDENPWVWVVRFKLRGVFPGER